MADPTPRPGTIDRKNMKTIVTYLAPETAKRLKIIAANDDMTMQDIGQQAIELWLKTYDKRHTAPHEPAPPKILSNVRPATHDDSIPHHLRNDRFERDAAETFGVGLASFGPSAGPEIASGRRKLKG